MRDNPHYRAGKRAFDFERIETRDVLSGAYKGKALRALEQGGDVTLHSHLVFITDEGEGEVGGCRQDPGRMVDAYGMYGSRIRERPTCPTCATKWDRLVAEYGEAILVPELTPNRAPRLRAGRADALAHGYWLESSPSDWSNVSLAARDVGDATYLGPIQLEDAQHAVFRLADGRTVAQRADMARNAYDFHRPFGGDRPPPPKFELGDQVRDIDTGATGKVSFIGQYDKLIGGWRYRVLEPDGTRKFWNETRMQLVRGGDMKRNHKGLLRRNADLPKPRPRVDTSLSRVSRLEREHTQRERPFDPEARYPRGTKSHHFAINAGSVKPYREPDSQVDTSWAVWYGPDGEDGDFATEVDRQIGGFVVREYQSVVGYFDEGTYDESEPFRVSETWVSREELEKLAISNQPLWDAMNESDDPDEAELSMVPDDADARSLILRYVAAFGVRYMQERGPSEESFAAELPR